MTLGLLVVALKQGGYVSVIGKKALNWKKRQCMQEIWQIV